MKGFMKFILVLLVIDIIGAAGLWWYLDNRPCNHKYSRNPNDTTLGTCQEKRIETYLCLNCGEPKTVETDRYGVHSYEYTTVKEATAKADGQRKGVCRLCDAETTSKIPRIGSEMSNPIKITSAELFKNVKSGGTKQYLNTWFRVTGKVKSIKRYSGLTGYYLEGSTGKGLVVWINEANVLLDVGTKADFIGRVEVDSGKDHVELASAFIINIY